MRTNRRNIDEIDVLEIRMEFSTNDPNFLFVLVTDPENGNETRILIEQNSLPKLGLDDLPCMSGLWYYDDKGSYIYSGYENFFIQRAEIIGRVIDARKY